MHITIKAKLFATLSPTQGPINIKNSEKLLNVVEVKKASECNVNLNVNGFNVISRNNQTFHHKQQSRCTKTIYLSMNFIQ